MGTTEQGVWYPEPEDPVSPLEAVFATMAQSVNDNVIRRIPGALSSAPSTTLPNEAVVYDADAKAFGVKDGNKWLKYVDIDSIIGPIETSDVLTIEAGWSSTHQRGQINGNSAWVEAVFTRTGATITANATGHIANVDMALIEPKYRIDSFGNMYLGPVLTNVTKQEQAWIVALTGANTIRLTSATIGNSVIETGDEVRLFTSWARY